MGGKLIGYIYRHTYADGRVPYFHSSQALAGDLRDAGAKCATTYSMDAWEHPAGSGKRYNVCIPEPPKSEPGKGESGPMAKADERLAARVKREFAEAATYALLEAITIADRAAGEAKVFGGQGGAKPDDQGGPDKDVGSGAGNDGEVGDAMGGSDDPGTTENEEEIPDGSDGNEGIIPGLEEQPIDEPPDEQPPEVPDDEDENDGSDEAIPAEEDDSSEDWVEDEDTSSMNDDPFDPDVEEEIWIGDWCPDCSEGWENYIIQGIPTDNWHEDPNGEPFTHASDSWGEWVLGTLDNRVYLRKGELGIWMETGQYHWEASGRWGGASSIGNSSTFSFRNQTTTIYHTIANDECTDVGWGQKAELGLWGEPLNNIDVYSTDYMRMTISYGESPYADVDYDGHGYGDTFGLTQWSKKYDINDHRGGTHPTGETRGLMWRLGYGCYPQYDMGVSHTIRWPGDGCRYTYSGDKSTEQGWASDALTALDVDTDCSSYEYSAVHCWYQTELNIMLEIISMLTPLDSSRYYKRIAAKKITASDLTALSGDEAVEADAIDDIYGTAATTTETMVEEGTYETPAGGAVTGDY